MRHRFIAAAGLMAMFCITTLQADVISITDPRYDVPNSPAGVIRPTRGMDMSQVEARFGPPQQKMAAVGQPPISRWHYPQFDVFFENSIVIHAVINRPQP